MGQKHLFAIQHIGNRKRFTEVLPPHPPPPPPPPRDQTNSFAYSCGLHDWSRGGERCQNAQKQFIIKTY